MAERAWQQRRHPTPARVLVVGGEDVDSRIDLMKLLSDRFHFAAAGSEIDLSTSFLDEGIPYFFYPLDRGVNPLQDARTFFFLGRVIKRLQPDLVHAFATKPAVWGRLAARWAGTPVVVGTLPGLGALYSRSDWRTRLVRSVYQPLQRRACHQSDLTIFQNERDLDQFVASDVVPSDRAVVIPGSGVRTEIMDPSRACPEARRAFRQEVGAGEGDLVITMISRLLRSKGVAEFTRAAELLTNEGLPVRFVLVGPEDHDSWDAMPRDDVRELQGWVRWLGERSDVRPVYSGSDVFVLPSYYREGMPRVLLEAASMGLPLVASRNAGSEAVVEDGRNGFLIEPRNVKALASKIRELVTQPLLRRRFAEEARRIALRRFDLRVIAEATGDHYERLLRASGRLPQAPLHHDTEAGARPQGSAWA